MEYIAHFKQSKSKKRDEFEINSVKSHLLAVAKETRKIGDKIGFSNLTTRGRGLKLK